MEHSDLLAYVTGVAEKLGLRYFVTGSTVTIFYGEPRFTNDIDIVVDLPETLITDFCRQFPDREFCVRDEAVRDAVRRRAQFNIIHPTSGFKVDVIVPESTQFNESRFHRAQRVQAGDDFQAVFSSPEDAIIKKMEFYREGGSEKHLRDIVGMLKTSRELIDMGYIEQWTRQLDLNDVWRVIQEHLVQET